MGDVYVKRFAYGMRQRLKALMMGAREAPQGLKPRFVASI
jgi:hypothetical protein